MQPMGGDGFYARRLDCHEIRKLFRSGTYAVNDNGEITRNGNSLRSYPNRSGHLFVRIYGDGGRKAIAVHRIVWMVSREADIPPGYEVHHIDGDVTNNQPGNLMCLHPHDHRLCHFLASNEVPF